MAKKAKTNGRVPSVYKSYVFRGDGDPVLGTVNSWIADSGKTAAQISRDSSVSTGTLGKWRKRVTRRPQFCTIAAVSKALGKNSIPLK